MHHKNPHLWSASYLPDETPGVVVLCRTRRSAMQVEWSNNEVPFVSHYAGCTVCYLAVSCFGCPSSGGFRLDFRKS